MAEQPLKLPAANHCLGWSVVISVLAVILLVVLTKKVEWAFLVLVLSALEISLSFDNAIVNAKVLSKLTVIWQRRFLFWGLPIAVFGMRLLFPMLLVYVTTPISVGQLFMMSWQAPELYSQLIEQGFPAISTFGGGFLLMVFFKFLLDTKRTVYWVRLLERHKIILWLGKYPWAYAVCVFIIGVLFSGYFSAWNLLVTYLIGMLIHALLSYLNSSFSKDQNTMMTLAKQGLTGFLYLELLDATFSMDSVLGAFAISANVLIVLVGLGIGALFVRTFTILLLQRKTLERYCFLEHGAYFAIGFLGFVMLAKNFFLISEFVIASVSLLFLVVAWIESKRVADQKTPPK